MAKEINVLTNYDQYHFVWLKCQMLVWEVLVLFH